MMTKMAKESKNGCVNSPLPSPPAAYNADSGAKISQRGKQYDFKLSQRPSVKHEGRVLTQGR